MARVSISEAARLVSVSRPTIYKLLKSGELSYTSVVKHGKSVKTIDTAELIRVFGAIEVVNVAKSDTVKFDDMPTSVNGDFLQSLQHQLTLLQAENAGLKDAVNARDEHISSLRQAMQLLEHKQSASDPQSVPAKSWWQFWKSH
ncbi:helix-turn-helix domain-containing protein [Salmonella enterica subsp. enterica serovar Anatum]|uniref:excisionase family DNA-binding protein n=1 Tax=Salmonella enterica TaxID=28901 RepID=UPI001264901D|nr:excisionase family DNA-binding protein [Salmonella enterica]EDW2030304.1 helix-turn-helix domain-containing protein [Salmonella enterica subsp. enterica]EBV6526765.1 DNA-binding protein [Salmonella enterica subsp. enterica serovar Anatum]EDV4653913.1 helix-turn-helix domain-containing protein [Salmonella enterica subsp. enterica serovar Anatum]EDW1214201.1 helix-turn-helix domain-containing protein [Salmonella enterica subsp. enterica serovar Anatum]EDW1742192.1 helix-turn-helix domain-cont